MGQLEGQQVEIVNFRRKPALNGRVGTLLSFNATEGICRVSVTEDGGGRRTHAIPPAAVRPLHPGEGRKESPWRGSDRDGTSPSAAISEGGLPAPLHHASSAVATAKEGAHRLLQNLREMSSAAVKTQVDALAPLSLVDLVKSIIQVITDLNATIDLDTRSESSGPIDETHRLLACQLLCVAAEYDDASAVKLLLEVDDSWGISTQSVDDERRSALWHASANGNARLLEFLLSRGAAFNRLDADGFSPLGVACQEGNVRCAQILLQVRAEVEGAFNRSSWQGSTWQGVAWTPLMAACDSGEADVTPGRFKPDRSFAAPTPIPRGALMVRAHPAIVQPLALVPPTRRSA